MDIESIATVARAIVTVMHEPTPDQDGWIFYQDQVLLIKRDLSTSGLAVQLKALGDQLQEVLFIDSTGSIETFQGGRTAIFQNWIAYLDELLKRAIERAVLLVVSNWRSEHGYPQFSHYVEQLKTIAQIAVNHNIQERVQTFEAIEADHE